MTNIINSKRIRNIFIYISLFVISTNSVNAQIKIMDSVTHKAIPYATIKFNKDNGLYCDENGEFSIDEISNNTDSLYISCLGYIEKKIELKSLQEGLIYLSPYTYELEEIVISNKTKKGTTKKIKPISHNDFLQAHMLYIGGELAIYIPNTDSYENVELKKLFIPIVTKTISFEKEKESKKQQVKKISFSTLYKISFYENNNGKPGKRLEYENITTILNEKSTIAILDLEKYSISLPQEGFFVGILNLGPTNDKGQLIPTSPFLEKETDKGVVKVVKPIKPYFPVYYNKKNNETFFRYTFGNDDNWISFFKHGTKKEGEYHNIGIGYEIKIYE